MRAYQICGGVDGPLEPVATYRIESDDEITGPCGHPGPRPGGVHHSQQLGVHQPGR